MAWTAVYERLSQVVAAGLIGASRLYEREADGRLVYRGLRPGPEREGHGTFRRMLFTLAGGCGRGRQERADGQAHPSGGCCRSPR